MMIAGPSALRLIGETVTVSYVADPSVGHGRFRLENHGPAAVVAAVESARLELGERRRPLADVTVFDLDRDRELSPQRFEVGPGAAMRFLLGFPVVHYEPRFGESGSVGLQLSANGVELQALSPIEFEHRIPYGF